LFLTLEIFGARIQTAASLAERHNAGADLDVKSQPMWQLRQSFLGRVADNDKSLKFKYLSSFYQFFCPSLVCRFEDH